MRLCPIPPWSGAEHEERRGQGVRTQRVRVHDGDTAPGRRGPPGAWIEDVRPFRLTARGHRAAHEFEREEGIPARRGIRHGHAPGRGRGAEDEDLSAEVEQGAADTRGVEGGAGRAQSGTLPESTAVDPRARVGAAHGRRVHWELLPAGGPNGRPKAGGIRNCAGTAQIPGIHQRADGGIEGTVRGGREGACVAQRVDQFGAHHHGPAGPYAVQSRQLSVGPPRAEERIHVLDRPDGILCGADGDGGIRRLDPDEEAGPHDTHFPLDPGRCGSAERGWRLYNGGDDEPYRDGEEGVDG